MNYPIDFVVPWVDDTDVQWRKKKAEYTGTEYQEENSDARYRDWDTLRYWFRGVEKFAPWVRYVFFITDEQKPEWLNVDHPKIKWVKHSDYIPDAYLPTFSSHVIEWNLYRIPELSEHFVYFNDDVFLIRDTVPEDFFQKGLPCDLPCIGPIYSCGLFANVLFNNAEILNRHFSFKESIKSSLGKWIQEQNMGAMFRLLWYGRRAYIPGSLSWHIHTSFQKKTFEILWEKEYERIHETCLNRLRTRNDVSIYCVRDWQLLSGQFHSQKPIGKYFYTASMSNSSDALEYLRKQKGKSICLNDSEDETDFDKHRQMILEAFETLFPEKSSFEL